MIKLCDTADCEPGEMVQAELPNGHKVAVCNVDGTFYVTDDTCTHGQSSLAEDGILEGHIVECSWHFGTFDVATGEAKTLPCTEPLATYAVTIVDGAVCIDEQQTG